MLCIPHKPNALSALCWMQVVRTSSWLRQGLPLAADLASNYPNLTDLQCVMRICLRPCQSMTRGDDWAYSKCSGANVTCGADMTLCPHESRPAACWGFYLQYSECFTALNKPLERRRFPSMHCSVQQGLNLTVCPVFECLLRWQVTHFVWVDSSLSALAKPR